MKIVINRCYGGFRLSNLAIKEYLKLKEKECYFYKHKDSESNTYVKTTENDKSIFRYIFTKDYGDTFKTYDNKDYFYDGNINRTDPDLIRVVESLGDNANDECSKLKVIEIPDEIEYEITEYDGMEQVEEIHSSWS